MRRPRGGGERRTPPGRPRCRRTRREGPQVEVEGRRHRCRPVRRRGERAERRPADRAEAGRPDLDLDEVDASASALAAPSSPSGQDRWSSIGSAPVPSRYRSSAAVRVASASSRNPLTRMRRCSSSRSCRSPGSPGSGRNECGATTGSDGGAGGGEPGGGWTGVRPGTGRSGGNGGSDAAGPGASAPRPTNPNGRRSGNDAGRGGVRRRGHGHHTIADAPIRNHLVAIRRSSGGSSEGGSAWPQERCVLRILPVALRGISSTSSTSRGILKLARFSRT